jgi:hypothetical protein
MLLGLCVPGETAMREKAARRLNDRTCEMEELKRLKVLRENLARQRERLDELILALSARAREETLGQFGSLVQDAIDLLDQAKPRAKPPRRLREARPRTDGAKPMASRAKGKHARTRSKRRDAAESLLALANSVPDEALEGVPTDGATRLDDYLYGEHEE